MRTIRAIYQDGGLKLLEAADLPENTPLTLELLEDDLSADDLAKVAMAGGAFDFLDDPAEAIYTSTDGEAI